MFLYRSWACERRFSLGLGLGLVFEMVEHVPLQIPGLVREGSLTSPESVEEHAPPSQIPGLNLTQFNEVGTFRSIIKQNTQTLK